MKSIQFHFISFLLNSITLLRFLDAEGDELAEDDSISGSEPEPDSGSQSLTGAFSFRRAGGDPVPIPDSIPASIRSSDVDVATPSLDSDINDDMEVSIVPSGSSASFRPANSVKFNLIQFKSKFTFKFFRFFRWRRNGQRRDGSSGHIHSGDAYSAASGTVAIRSGP